MKKVKGLARRAADAVAEVIDIRDAVRQEIGETAVEPFEVGCVAGDIIAMSELRVELHKVRKDQPARRAGHRRHNLIHPIVIAGRVHSGRDTAACEQVLDL